MNLSSKSSLVQLIPRLYDVTKGKVKVGGVDVRDYEDKSPKRFSSNGIAKKMMIFWYNFRKSKMGKRKMLTKNFKKYVNYHSE